MGEGDWRRLGWCRWNVSSTNIIIGFHVLKVLVEMAVGPLGELKIGYHSDMQNMINPIYIYSWWTYIWVDILNELHQRCFFFFNLLTLFEKVVNPIPESRAAPHPRIVRGSRHAQYLKFPFYRGNLNQWIDNAAEHESESFHMLLTLKSIAETDLAGFAFMRIFSTIFGKHVEMCLQICISGQIHCYGCGAKNPYFFYGFLRVNYGFFTG